MITPAIKDKVLMAIVAGNLPGIFLRYEQLFPDHEISNNELRLILEQFVVDGLLKTLQLRTVGVYVAFPTAKLFDFFNHGGFTAQEELLRANLEKLLGPLCNDADRCIVESLCKNYCSTNFPKEKIVNSHLTGLLRK